MNDLITGVVCSAPQEAFAWPACAWSVFFWNFLSVTCRRKKNNVTPIYERKKFRSSGGTRCPLARRSLSEGGSTRCQTPHRGVATTDGFQGDRNAGATKGSGSGNCFSVWAKRITSS